jgi:hypothetical protein
LRHNPNARSNSQNFVPKKKVMDAVVTTGGILLLWPEKRRCLPAFQQPPDEYPDDDQQGKGSLGRSIGLGRSYVIQTPYRPPHSSFCCGHLSRGGDQAAVAVTVVLYPFQALFLGALDADVTPAERVIPIGRPYGNNILMIPDDFDLVILPVSMFFGHCFPR